MYKIIYAGLILLTAVTSVSCTSPCRGKLINVGLIYGRNVTFQVFIDGKFMGKRYVDSSYEGHFFDPKGRMFKFCASGDSMLVKVQVNQRDTSFFIQPKAVKEIYIGSSYYGEIHVYLNNEKGGLGKYSPVF